MITSVKKIETKNGHNVIHTTDGRIFRRLGGHPVVHEGKQAFRGGVVCYSDGKMWSVLHSRKGSAK